MLFSVEVVSREDYDATSHELEDAGNPPRRCWRRGGRHPGRPRGRRDRGEERQSDRHRRTRRTGRHGTRKPLGQQVVRVLTTTDHKLIGKLYLVTSFAWFLVGGLMAMLMRSELAYPGQQVVNEELYNQLFTMHGTIMLLLFATPLFFGFANVIMPLQIGVARRRVPAAEHVQLLAVPLRRPHRRAPAS